jgi:hypothetical protein
MTLHTAADHGGPSLYAPHPTPLLQFDDTTFPTTAAYGDVPDSAHNYFPASSFFHCSMIEQLTPPTLVLNLQQQSLDFHSSLTNALAMTLGSTPYITDSVTRICGQPRVFSFADRYYIQRVSATDGTLFNSGANICITTALSLLVDVVDIPPFTFSIGRDGTTPSIDDCCTKRGLLPIPMADGSLYYQPCYFCQNGTETIISPQAIMEASDTFTSWHQAGHMGGLPGSIRFESASGILSMTLSLHSINGLYYCPLDVLAFDSNPTRSTSSPMCPSTHTFPTSGHPPNTNQSPKIINLSRKFGAYVLAAPVKTSWTSYRVMFQVSLVSLNTTLSSLLTSMPKPEFDNRPPNVQLCVWKNAAGNFIWILDLCELWLMTTPNHPTQLTGLSFLTTDSHHTKLLRMLLHGLFGSSSQNLRNPHWILLRRSCAALLSLMAGSFILIKVASSLDLPPSVTCSSVNLDMLWKGRELTAHLKMGQLRSVIHIAVKV